MIKKEFDDLTIEVNDYLVTVTYDKNKNFSEHCLNAIRQMMEISFPSYYIKFIEKEN